MKVPCSQPVAAIKVPCGPPPPGPAIPRVTQWSMSKGLENSDLIRLKRVAQNKKPPAQGVGAGGPGGGPATNAKKESFISRMASGMCADFNSKDPSFYIVGTEEGSVHKCSVSYNEQYLESYFGHSGPVYKVAWYVALPSPLIAPSQKNPTLYTPTRPPHSPTNNAHHPTPTPRPT